MRFDMSGPAGAGPAVSVYDETYGFLFLAMY
jgi:hypothetical protein